MLTEIRGGARMALSHWRSGLLISACLSFMVFMLTIVVVGLSEEDQDDKILSQVRAQEGYAFTVAKRTDLNTDPNKEPDHDKKLSPRAPALLEELLSQPDTYGIAPFDVPDDDSDSEGSHGQFLVIIGEGIEKVHPHVNWCSPAPCAMRGAKTTPFEPTIHSGEITLPGDGHETVLKEGAAFWAPDYSLANLDYRKILRLNPRDISKLTPSAQRGLSGRVILLGKPEEGQRQEILQEFLKESYDSGHTLIPVALDGPQRPWLSTRTHVAILVLILVLALSALAVIAYCLHARRIVDRTVRALAIRRMCGGTPEGSYLRMASYIGFSMALIPGLVGIAILIFDTYAGIPFGATVSLATLLIAYLLVMVDVGARVKTERFLQS